MEKTLTYKGLALQKIISLFWCPALYILPMNNHSYLSYCLDSGKFIPSLTFCTEKMCSLWHSFALYWNVFFMNIEHDHQIMHVCSFMFTIIQIFPLCCSYFRGPYISIHFILLLANHKMAFQLRMLAESHMVLFLCLWFLLSVPLCVLHAHAPP